MTEIQLWSIPELWPGSTVFIIGGGPSLMGMNLEPLKDKRVIGTNVAFLKYPWVDVTFFGDCGFRATVFDQLWRWRGLKITCCDARTASGWNDVRVVGRSRKRFGIEHENRSKISWNGNTGASAINLAWWLGARTVVLLGFDMRPVGEQHNWHDFYPKRGRNFNPYRNHMKGWPHIAADAAQIGLSVCNATPDSAIQEFPYVPLEELI